MNGELRRIERRIEDHQRLDPSELRTLFTSDQTWHVGRLADAVRRRRHGDVAYYNVNRHLNYTNVCALSCHFCDFHRKRGQAGAYEHSMERIVAEARQARQAGATEMHIVGGLHPYLPFSYYTDMLRCIREEYPQVHLKAFTAVEIVHLARIDRRPRDIEGVLGDLVDAGLGSLPGGGAEVFDDRVHDQAFKGKIRHDRWLDVHRIAHGMGLRSNATILYGHVESLDERIAHLVALREAQDEAIEKGHAGRFQAIIPLPFIPGQSVLKHLSGSTGLENLKMLALCRLALDNFDHVKAFWVMQTLPITELSLQHGVDDVDGTVVWYDITKVCGDESTHQEVTVGSLRQMIRRAGCVAVERDTLYRPVVRDGACWHVAEAVEKEVASN